MLCYNFRVSAIALYKALLDAGASEELAERAVEDLPLGGGFVTKADISGIKADISEFKVNMANWRPVSSGGCLALSRC